MVISSPGARERSSETRSAVEPISVPSTPAITSPVSIPAASAAEPGVTEVTTRAVVVLGGHAQEGEPGLSVVDELTHDRADGRRGDRESERVGVARRRDAGGIDPDHLAGGVDERAARVSGGDGGIRLDQVDVGAVLIEVAVNRRHDAGRHGVLEAERIAERDGELADARQLGSELRGGQIGPVDPDDGEIRVGIGGHNLGGNLISRGELNLHVLGPLDNVVVRHDEPTGAVPDDAGALCSALRRLHEDGHDGRLEAIDERRNEVEVAPGGNQGRRKGSRRRRGGGGRRSGRSAAPRGNHCEWNKGKCQQASFCHAWSDTRPPVEPGNVRIKRRERRVKRRAPRRESPPRARRRAGRRSPRPRARRGRRTGRSRRERALPPQ